MIIKYAIALAILIILAAVFTWAFLPARHLPGNRARHLRIRLHLRLHPGKGFAHAFSLWLRWPPWPPCAAQAGSAPASRCGAGSPNPTSTQSSSAGPTTGTASTSRWKNTCSSWPRPAPTRPAPRCTGASPEAPL